MTNINNYYKYSLDDSFYDMYFAHKSYIVNNIQSEKNKLQFTNIFHKLQIMLKLHHDLDSFITQLQYTYGMLRLNIYEKLAYETMIDICKSLQKKGY